MAARRTRLPKTSPKLRLVAARHPWDVVVVEDHDDTRAMICELLVYSGLRVRGFRTVEIALPQIFEQVPDIVVTDLNFVSRSGMELARALRVDVRTKSVPIVAVTGSSEPTAAAIRAFDAYFVKPIDAVSFPGVLRGLAEAHAVRRTS